MSSHGIGAVTELCAGDWENRGSPLCARNFAGTDRVHLNKASSLTSGKSWTRGETLPNKDPSMEALEVALHVQPFTVSFLT